MPTGMTFTTLQSDLQSYLERGTPQDAIVFQQIPRLINLAERAIARKLKIEGFINIVLSTLQPGVAIYLKPDRWRRTVSMNYGNGLDLHSHLLTEQANPLITESGNFLSVSNFVPVQNDVTPIFPRSYEYCRKYSPDSTVQGAPKFYADYDYTHWLIVPTPDVVYPWEILYYQLPPLLDNTNQTNWLTDFAPNALLYRALLEATPFLKNDERIPTWQAFYEEEIGNLNTEDLQKAADRSAVRTEA